MIIDPRSLPSWRGAISPAGDGGAAADAAPPPPPQSPEQQPQPTWRGSLPDRTFVFGRPTVQAPAELERGLSASSIGPLQPPPEALRPRPPMAKRPRRFPFIRRSNRLQSAPAPPAPERDFLARGADEQ
jgi:hypothetical protein